MVESHRLLIALGGMLIHSCLTIYAEPAVSDRVPTGIATTNAPADPDTPRVGEEDRRSDPDPFFEEKSAESQFLVGAWEGYFAGLAIRADNDLEHTKKVALWFKRMQQGILANVQAYGNLKRECSDTDEHRALFLQVDKVARLIDAAFAKRFCKPTRLERYLRWCQNEANRESR